MSTSKDKRKKLLKRLSKIRRSERKDKKKKRTKNRGSSRNSLYQEYAYQQQNRSSTYLLVLFIVLLLAAVGIIVYFFAIKPKLDEEKKECNIDCGETKYLNKEDCECLPCGEPDPTCKPKHYYDTSKCNEKNPKYGCQPCPTDCGPGKRREGCSGLSKGECVAIPTQPPSSNDNKKSGGLRPGAIAGIVFGVIAFIVIVALFLKSRSGSKRINNSGEQVFKNPVYQELKNVTTFKNKN